MSDEMPEEPEDLRDLTVPRLHPEGAPGIANMFARSFMGDRNFEEQQERATEIFVMQRKFNEEHAHRLAIVNGILCVALIALIFASLLAFAAGLHWVIYTWR